MSTFPRANCDCDLLQVDKLTKRFPGVIALDNVCLTLKASEIHALCGENGAGKSTLIRILCGVYPAGTYEGIVALEGCPVEFHNITEAEQAGITVIHQELALTREMTVAENIFLGSEPTRHGLIDWNHVYFETKKLLDQFSLNLDPTARVGDLGIGQQQLVEIIKALSKKSRILLLDEPTAALNTAEAEILLKTVRYLKDQGITCVYISHKLEEVFALADRITILRDGRTITTLPCQQTDKAEVIHHMVGREINEFFPRRTTVPGKVLLKVENLSVARPGETRLMLENLSFELHAGEVLGVGGLMGAGRTELLLHLFTSYGIRLAGRVYLYDEQLTDNTAAYSLRRGMALVSEDRQRYGLVLDQNIGFNLSLASLRQFTHRALIDHARENQCNQAICDSLNIRATSLEVTVRGLSGGNQQKVVLGKTLMTEPSVVFLDEPTRGIDVGAKVEVYELINRLTSQDKAVLLATSELPELMAMSDRMIILSAGRMGGIFTRQEATQEAILTAAMAHHEEVPS